MERNIHAKLKLKVLYSGIRKTLFFAEVFSNNVLQCNLNSECLNYRLTLDNGLCATRTLAVQITSVILLLAVVLNLLRMTTQLKQSSDRATERLEFELLL